MSPTNFILTNHKVLRATLESGRENLIRGFANLLEDLDHGKGQLRMKITNLESFNPGENVAPTPGNVVFVTELMRLLQYVPT